MSRSVTLALPPARQALRFLVALVAVVAIVLVGARIGAALISPGPAAEFGRGDSLQEVQTAGGTYVGVIVADDGRYLRLVGAAIVRPESSTSERLIVQMLTSSPFDLDGTVLIAREQVLFIGNVRPQSGLETAYRQATGELPQPTAAPSQ